MRRRFRRAIPLLRRITFEIYFGAAGGGGDFCGPFKESKADCACAGILPNLFSQRPRRRKGTAVAMTRSFAFRRTLTSGSQRKSCVDRKKVRMAQQTREPSETRTLGSHIGADSKMARRRPWTR